MPLNNKWLWITCAIALGLPWQPVMADDAPWQVSKVFRSKRVAVINAGADAGLKKFRRICLYRDSARVACGKIVFVRAGYSLVRVHKSKVESLREGLIARPVKRRRSNRGSPGDVAKATEPSKPQWEGTLSGSIEPNARYYLNEADNPAVHQHRDQYGIKLAPKYELSKSFGRQKLSMELFYRHDSIDENRNGFDVRELLYSQRFDDLKLSLGVGKVFWGVLETVNLTDVINQEDFAESFDGKVKLGQPMAAAEYSYDDYSFEFYVLPFFRQRTLPGEKSRFGVGLEIDSDETRYEGEREEWHGETALQLSGSFDDLEIAFNMFRGYDREPRIDSELDGRALKLIPRYEIMSQTGFTTQYTIGELLMKAEASVRVTRPRNFSLFGTGLEYNFYGILGSQADLGIIAESYFDDRKDESTRLYQQDSLAALRLVLNDANTTEATLGFKIDTRYGSQALSFDLSSGSQGSVLFKLLYRQVLFAPREDTIAWQLRQASFVEAGIGAYL